MSEIVLAAQIDEEMYMRAALEEHKGLIVTEVSKLRIAGYTHADLMSEMKIAFVKAVRGWNPELGAFSAYLYNKIRGQASKLIAQRRAFDRWKLLNRECPMPEYYDHEDDYTYMKVPWPLPGLSERECLIIELRLAGWSLTEMGRVLGASAQYMRVLKLNTVDKALDLI